VSIATVDDETRYVHAGGRSPPRRYVDVFDEPRPLREVLRLRW
jgi:hypothetical protein